MIQGHPRSGREVARERSRSQKSDSEAAENRPGNDPEVIQKLFKSSPEAVQKQLRRNPEVVQKLPRRDLEEVQQRLRSGQKQPKLLVQVQVPDI